MKKAIRPAAALMVFVFFLLACMGLPPQGVHADGLTPVKVVTHRLLSLFTLTNGVPITVPLMTLESDSGTPAYCLTPHNTEPYPASAVGYLGHDPAVLFGSEAFVRGVTAIVQHGYPTTTTLDGIPFSPEEAQYATGTAIWWLHAALGMPGAITPVAAAVPSGHDSLFAAAYRLYETGCAQLVRTASVSVGSAGWVYREGRLECSFPVDARNIDVLSAGSVPEGVQATFAAGTLTLRTTDVSVLQRELSVEVTGTSVFANGNLIWLQPDVPSYQSVVAVSGTSRFAASASAVPEVRTGGLLVRKTDQEGNPVVSGTAVFRLSAADAGSPAGFTRVEDGRYAFGGTLTDLESSGGTLQVSGMPEAPSGWMLREVSPPYGYLAFQGDIPVRPSDPPAAVEVGNQDEMVRVRIVKRDADTGAVPQGEADFSGAEFEIWHKDYPDYGQAPEDRRDRVVIPAGADAVESKPMRGGADPGFRIRELTPPEGYVGTEEILEAGFDPVGGDRVAVVTVENHVVSGSIAIEKRGASTGADPAVAGPYKPLVGVSFVIYALQDGRTVQTLVTGEDGKAVSEPLPFGRYRVEELAGEGNRGYILSEPFETQIREPGEVLSFTVDNEPIRSPVSICKTDAETGMPVLQAGIAWRILTGEGEPAVPGTDGEGTVVSDPDGIARIPEGLATGDYQVVETLPPEGYAVHAEPVPFHVGDEGEPVELPFPDSRTRVVITKTAIDDGRPLDGAEFSIADAEGEECMFILTDGIYRPGEGGAGTLTSDSDGTVRISGLPAGDYILTETTPPQGFRLPDDPRTPIRVGPENDTVHPVSIALVNEEVPEPVATVTTAPTSLPTEPIPLAPSPAPTTPAPPIPATGEHAAAVGPAWIPAVLLAALLYLRRIRNASPEGGPARPDRRIPRPW